MQRVQEEADRRERELAEARRRAQEAESNHSRLLAEAQAEHKRSAAAAAAAAEKYRRTFLLIALILMSCLRVSAKGLLCGRTLLWSWEHDNVNKSGWYVPTHFPQAEMTKKSCI